MINGEQFSTLIKDYCYAYFGGLGQGLSKVFREAEKDLDLACMNINAEVYFSIVGLAAILSTILPLSIIMLSLMGYAPVKGIVGENPATLVILTLLVPGMVLLIGIIIPKIKASTRMSELKIEIPYSSMYISVMVSGGLSPYESFLRMKKTDLLPRMKEEVKRIQNIVLSTGVDPLTGMEQAAKVIDIKDYKELLLGYASSVRSGGDTLHYLFNQTSNMFRNLKVEVKAKGETAAMLMEAYTIIGILGVLGIFLIFVVGLSLPTAGVSISPYQFFFFSFIVMPALSLLFLYAGDMVQFNYPISSWKTYHILLVSLPLGGFLASQMALPFFKESFLIIPQLRDGVIWIREALHFAEGTEPSIGVTLSLIFISLTGWASDYYYAGRDNNLQEGITQFLRDLVEVRKSGLSPEKSIEVLSRRYYKGFSRYLTEISTKINWGYPLRQIYDEFASQVKNWLALINIYLLIDTMEVGGGSEQSLESLAEFSEATKQLEAEKKATLMPLVVVPYIGAALLTGTTVMFLGFFSSSSLGITVPQVSLYKTLLTPLAIHSFTLGLVTGKIVSGRVSSGFKHSVFLSLVSLLGIWAVSNLNLGGGLI